MISLLFVTFCLYEQYISAFGFFFVLYILKFEIKIQKSPTLSGIPGSVDIIKHVAYINKIISFHCKK
jgi:hypothetical protein